MRRRLVAAVWIVGATIPLVVASVFLAGCCVLPFHGVVHRLMPLCSLATDVIRGEPADDHQPAGKPSAPAREREQPVRRLVPETVFSFRLEEAERSVPLIRWASAKAYRSFISFGALRCDRDVGLHLIDSTFLI